MNEAKEIARLRKDNKKLKKAVMFYADLKNYGYYDGEPRKPGDFYEPDLGEVARKALLITSNFDILE